MQIMIVGAGLVGQYLCEKLSTEGKKVILIDTDKEKLQRIERELNIMTIHGSGASAMVLAEAGIAKTDLFIAVTNSDEVNLVACIMSRRYDVSVRIARVRHEEILAPGLSQKDDALGIDLVISPDWAMTEGIMQLIHASEAFYTAEFAEGRILLLGYQVHENNPFIGMTLFELKQQLSTRHYVVTAIVRDGKTIIPHGGSIIANDDKIYLMVRKNDMTEIEQTFKVASHLPQNVFIIGGSDIGYITTRQLEELGVKVKLAEIDYERCEFLSENLGKSIVLNIDGLDAHDMLEEGIEFADVVIAVTDSDTTNILSSLLAKHHGTKKCITKITRHDFIPMLSKLGIDVALSPRQVAADMILRYVRRGDIISITTILDTDAEVMEVTLPDHKNFDQVPIQDLASPDGLLIGAVVRDTKTIIPTGATVIRPGDNLVTFFSRDRAHEVEKFFSPNE